MEGYKHERARGYEKTQRAPLGFIMAVGCVFDSVGFLW